MMKLLLATDLHLTAKAADKYRWGLFQWLVDQANHHRVDAVCILGDLTDAKDRHSAELVNLVMDHLALLTEEIDGSVILLAGNHDFIDPQCPFFRMSQYIGGIYYVKEKRIITLETGEILAVPFHREGIENLTFSDNERACPLLLCHQTFSGAIASNGMKMEGESQQIFEAFKGKIFSGDIHVPQQLQRVTYVGAPYRIRFNDTFEPRVLLYNDITPKKLLTDLSFPCLRRHTLVIKSPDGLNDAKLFAEHGVRPGDQVKIRLRLKKSQYSEWTALKSAIQDIGKERELVVCGVELESIQRAKLQTMEEVDSVPVKFQQPVEVLETFCHANQIDTYRETIGKALL